MRTLDQVTTVLRHADAVCFDVDSTVCVDEAIDELAKFLNVGDVVQRATSDAMNGNVTYRTALRQRLDLMKPSRQQIDAFKKQHPPNFTRNICQLTELLRKKQVDIYLVSGGFLSLIEPVAERLNIPLDRVFANRLLFYYGGQYAGFDHEAETSESGGKVRVVQHLKTKFGYRNLVFIGDGMTDLETSETADAFIGFGGNIVRENVKRSALWFVDSFREIIDVIDTKSEI